MPDKPKRRLRNLKLDRVDLVTAGANPGAFVMIHKFDAPDNLEVVVAEQIVEAHEAPVEKDDNVSQEVETVAKADFEALQKQYADMQKTLEDTQALEQVAAQRIAKMEREAKEAEFLAKAKEFGNLGGAEELSAVLLDASENMAPEKFQSLDRLLKAANAQMEKGHLFAQFGKVDGEAQSAEDKLTELAKAKVAAGTAKTIEIAQLQVLNENPDLGAELMKVN